MRAAVVRFVARALCGIGVLVGLLAMLLGPPLAVAGTSGGAGGSITVKESDGSPTVAGATVLQLSGCTVTDNGAGDVTVTCTGASPSGSGSELQYRVNGTTFGAVTSSSVSGADVSFGGNVTIGSNLELRLPQENVAASPTLCFYGGGTCNSGIFEGADNWLFFVTAGSARWNILSSGAFNGSLGPSLRPIGTNATTPNIHPDQGNLATGLGAAGSNQLSLIANSAEGLRVDASATATHTRFLVYDVDNATLERVTVGAADSCGSGFKCLRIPN